MPDAMTADETAMIEAAVNGDLPRVRELLARGVPADVRTVGMYPLGMEWNVTPLMCAAAKGHVEILRALLDAGADVAAACEANKVDGGPGSTALRTPSGA